MVLKPLVMVLMLKISPSSTSFPACVASHGGRGSKSSSSNRVLNAVMATCDISCVADHMLLSLSAVDDVPQILACLVGGFILTGKHCSVYIFLHHQIPNKLSPLAPYKYMVGTCMCIFE
ncbi:unnamed protein product [Musa acuminata subsp. burmannicoides]